MKRIRIVAGLLACAAAQAGCSNGCPTIEDFLDYRPPEASRVFAADGSKMADLSPERRIVVALDAVPEVVRDGFVAVEDRRFWDHGGVDLRGFARAAWVNLRARSLEQGFSTITMQLARSVFAHELPRGRSLRRKACELRLARRIEDRLEKPEILRRYLNQVYMGEGIYGIEAAARAYFAEPASRLDLPEAALLIGLAKNPEGYNPRRHPLSAAKRRDVVLDVMVREGVVTADRAAAARKAEARVAPPIEASGPAPYVVAAVRSALRARFGEDAETRGLRVHTGIEPDLQQAARRALVAQIEAIEGSRFGPYRHAAPPSGRLEPVSKGASPFLQGMVLTMDVRTGDVRALVGGRDFVHSSYDRALSARRQPGSAFKPIVYAAALERGLTPADPIDTSPVAVSGSGAVWQPADLVRDEAGAMSAREALARSSNHAAVRVGQFAGVENVVALAHELGIATPIPPYPSVFLGSAEVNPAEFVAAFATLSNGGRLVRPRLIVRVEDAHGNLIWAAPAEGRQVMDPGVAFLAVDMMTDVIERGTASVVRSTFDRTAAGKTGTTNEGRDVWFVGMTSDLATGVWLGFDEPRPIVAGATGGRLAAPVWAAVMAAAYSNRPPPEPWTRPANVLTETVDARTGALATGRCPLEDVREEFFLAGTEPRDYCPLHRASGIERLIGGLLRRLGRIF